MSHETTAAHGHDPHLQHHFDTPEQQMESGKLGMWLFLAQELLFFGGVFCAYAIFRAHNPGLFSFGSSMLNWKMGAVNTVILICSSLTMAWAVRCAQVGQKRLLLLTLTATQVFAFGFLFVKYFEYEEKIHHGLLWGTLYEPDEHTLNSHGWTLGVSEEPAGSAAPEAGEPADSARADDSGVHGGVLLAANALPAASVAPAGDGHGAPGAALALAPANGHLFFGIYFVMTGLHLLHVVVGMGAIAWLMLGAWRGVYGPSFFNPVDIVGLYWHLVDLIWIFLFPLLYLIH